MILRVGAILKEIGQKRQMSKIFFVCWRTEIKVFFTFNLYLIQLKLN